MPKDLSEAMLARLEAARKRPALFVEMELASSTLRFWNGVGPFTWAGHDWVGLGMLVALGPIRRSADVVATGLNIQVTGAADDRVKEILAEVRRNRPCTVWLGFFDDAWALVASPDEALSGRMDAPIIDDDAETVVVNVAVESDLLDLDRPRVRYATHEEHVKRFSGDTIYKRMESLALRTIKWGG